MFTIAIFTTFAHLTFKTAEANYNLVTSKQLTFPMAKRINFQSPFYAASEFPFNDGILKGHLQKESDAVKNLLSIYKIPQLTLDTVRAYTEDYIQAIQECKGGVKIETFLKEYGLDNHEGVILMSLAEALLRIPDDETAERFLKDKLHTGNWALHAGHSETFWVNFSTWGLVLTGKLLDSNPKEGRMAWLSEQVQNLLRKMGEPLVLTAVRQAMLVIGQQFVSGQTIHSALEHGLQEREHGYSHSFDMLGEAAVTQQDVGRYIGAYSHAIDAIAEHNKQLTNQPHDGNENSTAQTSQPSSKNNSPIPSSISIKLSALHPRFEIRQKHGLEQLKDNLLGLLNLAYEKDVPVTIDAEESWRLEPTLMIFAQVIGTEPFRHWGKLGIAVQTYQKSALGVLEWLSALSKTIHCLIPVRLVKGAYWDSEIKRAQQLGLKEYPVFTSKAHTDLSYLACVHTLMKTKHFLYPQFATHNAHTVASIITLAQEYHYSHFEFQRLHGMGQALYDHLLENTDNINCRIYAPVGEYTRLLPYLVRRLLENGASTSFVRLVNQNVDVNYLAEEPVLTIKNADKLRNPYIPLPSKLFSPVRKNSQGINLESSQELRLLKKGVEPFLNKQWNLHDIDEPGNTAENQNTDTNGSSKINDSIDSVTLASPADSSDIIGSFTPSTRNDCHQAFDTALAAFSQWKKVNADDRADYLLQVANLYEENRHELIALAMREAGKTIANAYAEIREAVDFCRYYAQQARQQLSEGTQLKGVTGEQNTLTLEGRGPVLCISPWNFPLAIFTGQIAAALAAGNTVIAKPSTLTPLIAHRAVELFHQVGVPKDALQFLPAAASTVDSSILNESKLAAVMFTGSTVAATTINRKLALRNGPIIPFIAETGGQNAMIVDSSALPEQVVKDVVASAFDSTGQRCSALRVLYIQEDIKETIVELLVGYMKELGVASPCHWHSDVGPVITHKAQVELNSHIERFRLKNQVIYQTPLATHCSNGSFVSPTVIEIEHINELFDEVFGPVLHVISFAADAIDDVIQQINGTGFGLTLGIHSRISGFCQYISDNTQVGNIYVNRNMVGATVGVQPFGGQGLSGTGPKAGGPHYLLRLVTEKSLSINTAAIGGDTQLLSDEHYN
ncbi:hypothetical protein A9Q81_08025 [Gammaproteobacteria bacterium 42_54_T18]|nr:hypothetical protein A9Q81_08025 [Gammaproteobacteria bacterium 42_54_T18]